ncbi:hypothetical protein [Paenibacillus hamazuiensis]|uniref:hypothetical protein n=1 Tax=Paenibacillus hamazuiensis TaxID=2936508 RepID=UPI00200D500F|nr:hypothetical protein [Paenibacillus hamazuiensis]
MKQLFRRALLPAIAASMVFVLPAAALEAPDVDGGQARTAPREMAFQIPMNNFCSNDNAFDFSFQLSNASDRPTDVTLFLYQKNGSSFLESGTSYAGMESTIVPGTPLTLKANATEFYHLNFGNNKTCSERIYMGKIVAGSGQAKLLAKGWVRRTGVDAKETESIVINENNAFELAP